MTSIDLQLAREALCDALLDYNVPTGRILAEFDRLIADPLYVREASSGYGCPDQHHRSR